MYNVSQKQGGNEYKETTEVFDKNLNDRITMRDQQKDITNVPYWNRLSVDENNTNFDEDFNKLISGDDVPEADDNNAVKTPDMFDSYINMKVVLSKQNFCELYHATVKRRAIDDDGKPLGV